MEQKTDLTRRGFFKASLGGVLAGVGLSGLSLGKTVAAACGLTPPQTEGPFYPNKDQADKDNDLTWVKGRRERASGQIIQIAGRVTDEDCKPVPQALVEIWQACESGRYNHDGDPNPAPLDPNFQYWGKAITDGYGIYAFTTIMPGHYPATPTWIRPSHIHFKISKRGFHELTTQMYFEGNPYNEGDRILRALPPEEQRRVIVRLEETGVAEPGSKLCRFDITIHEVR